MAKSFLCLSYGHTNVDGWGPRVGHRIGISHCFHSEDDDYVDIVSRWRRVEMGVVIVVNVVRFSGAITSIILHNGVVIINTTTSTEMSVALPASLLQRNSTIFIFMSRIQTILEHFMFLAYLRVKLCNHQRSAQWVE